MGPCLPLKPPACDTLLQLPWQTRCPKGWCFELAALYPPWASGRCSSGTSLCPCAGESEWGPAPAPGSRPCRRSKPPRTTQPWSWFTEPQTHALPVPPWGPKHPDSCPLGEAGPLPGLCPSPLPIGAPPRHTHAMVRAPMVALGDTGPLHSSDSTSHTAAGPLCWGVAS